MNILKLKAAKFVLLIALSVLAIASSGCSKGLSTQPPVFPVSELPEGIAVAANVKDPALLKTLKDAGHDVNKTLVATTEDVTIAIEYWSTYRLNRAFNRGSMTSPFFYQEAWHQGDKTDAFYLTIINNRNKPIYFKPEACSMKDDRQYFYTGMTYDDLEKKLRYKIGKKLDLENGLQKAKEILVSTQLNKGEIASKQMVKGFIPFNKIARAATKVFVTIVIEKSPETNIGRYQKLELVFPFVQDSVILAAQPAVQRY